MQKYALREYLKKKNAENSLFFKKKVLHLQKMYYLCGVETMWDGAEVAR